MSATPEPSTTLPIDAVVPRTPDHDAAREEALDRLAVLVGDRWDLLVVGLRARGVPFALRRRQVVRVLLGERDQSDPEAVVVPDPVAFHDVADSSGDQDAVAPREVAMLIAGSVGRVVVVYRGCRRWSSSGCG